MSDSFVHLFDNTLSLGNASLERRFAAAPGQPFVTTAFMNRLSGRDYLRPGGREFAFAADGQPFTGLDFTFERAELTNLPDRAGATVHLSWASVAVELHFTAYAAHPVIRKWLVVTNRGDRAVSLTDFEWEEIHLLVDSPATAEVWVDYFTRREKSAAVTMDDCALIVNDPARGEGFVVATEAPGPLKRLEAYARPGRIAAGYNRDDETNFERVLDPGESFRSHESFILVFANSIPQDAVDGPYAEFVAEQLTACDVSRVPTVTVNTWEPHGFNLSRELLLEQIDLAADLGVDAYQVDAGWYDFMGDWNADPAKFPNGLEEIAEHARARGMRFGLWVAPPTADERSKVARDHPEWIARDRHGAPNRHPIPNVVTMCLDSGFRDYILSKLDEIIRRYGVELLKLDLSCVRNLYEPGRYPGCFAEGHGHRTPRESHLRILERLFEIVAALKSAHPRCLFDLSYELYGVMDGHDLALIKVADQNWFTNLTSPHETNFRREAYQRGRVTRPWTLNFGGASLDHPHCPNYGLFSTFTSHALFWGDLARLDEATRAHYRRWFAWLKTQRARDDFYRYYRVSDIFPVPDGVSSRDFRRAVPSARYGIAPDGIHPPGFDPVSEHPGHFWDGVARLNERGEGPVFLFRPAGSRHSEFQLRLPWVLPESRYLVRDETESRDLGVFDGKTLIEAGISVTIARPAEAKVIVLRLDL
ncbi:MAG: alpha-galactosidase [Chloroflexi bacterium]|nr:alpha-galactosidase [Chloroflexota bacterium]